MEIEALIKKMKDIYSPLIDFLDATDDFDAKFRTLIEILDGKEILPNQDEAQLLFQLISKLADNHHRTSGFFYKFEKIFQYLITNIPSPISYFIPDYTSYNKGILFLLLGKGFVKPDEQFLKQYLQSKPVNIIFASKKFINMSQTYYYLYPKMKDFIDEKTQKIIEKEILEEYIEEEISTFEEKCQIGENDSYICTLIRSDSVEEFITYINRTNLSLTSKIKSSIYETHSFLIDKEPTLIEYAAFFGSIQIIRYLKYNEVPLTSSLWIYAVHSNNAELIHFLEENRVKLDKNIDGNDLKNPYDDVLIESIKCHHNDISNYIKDYFYEQIKTDDQNYINEAVVSSLNFFFVPSFKFESIICNQKNLNEFKLSQLCFSLTHITIPSSVTSIGHGIFYECSSLIEIAIPFSVTSIRNYAFSCCKSLTQIAIPSSITSIGNDAFSGCSSLTQITIPSSVTEIGNNAFSGCSSLTQITIPSSVTEIGNNAFSGCSSLTQITIPSSVTSIGNNAFNECSSLTQIIIPFSVTSIGNSAFSECSSLTQIIIPSSVTKIGHDAFSKCSLLTQITIPSSITLIDNYAFNECSSLSQITIPSSVTSIGNYAFNECSSLTQITIPSSVTSICDHAFCECQSLIQISIPSFITSIKGYTFSFCKSLTKITIPSSVTSIGFCAFCECYSLKQIIIPPSVTEIGWNAFFGCSSLEQITIPSSVTNIGCHAFDACPSLSFESRQSIDKAIYFINRRLLKHDNQLI